MKKMNNKGFSLVELIVVVLIMAIIAVALAPQVMKWVENSRKSTDIENYNALIEAANVATTNEDVIKELASHQWTIRMDANSSSVTGDGSGSTFTTLMTATLPGWTNTKITAGAWKNSTFTIDIAQNGNYGVKVEKCAFPTKDFD
jgi:prepilin-type N-terminal cleavage/methylation domain-containing protein